jgi:RimJ/RimL family protein N-acetyltransferase
VFTTERLTVRPWSGTDADIDRFYDIYSRWEVARWLGATPRALTGRDQASKTIARWSSHGTEPWHGIWAIEVRDTGVVAGTVLLIELPNGAGEIEVGWHLHPDSWGHGYATEAARAVLHNGFAHGLSEVFAVVRPGNDASMAVCRRLGMTPLGRTTRWYGVDCEAFRLKNETGHGDVDRPVEA